MSVNVSNSRLVNRSAECKRKNTLWNGINYAVRTDNDSLLSKDKTTLQWKIQGDNVVVDIVSLFRLTRAFLSLLHPL